MNMSCKAILLSLLKDESGQDLVEYALVLAAVVSIAVAATTGLSKVVTDTITAVGTKISGSV